MTALVDTNILVRYLTGEPPELAAKAAEIMDGQERLGLTSVVVAEVGYVLSRVYGIDRTSIVDELIRLLQKENIYTATTSKSLLLEALLLCRPSRRIAFADAMIWAEARHRGIDRVYTLDRRFPGDGIERLP